MKAVVVERYGGPEVLEYKEVAVPEISENEVLIRTAVLGVNFADVQAKYGKYHGANKPPIIPGLDAAGTIEKVGSSVKELQPGQRVFAFTKGGSYAEYVVADRQLVFPIPEKMNMETAAASPVVALTSYKLLVDRARIQKGETVLIHAAAGGVGTTAIQLAKILGARQVIGTVGSEAKKAVALKAGADKVVNYEEEDFVQAVLEATDGKGVDIVLDSISGTIAERSLECLAMYGRLVHFGNISGKPANINIRELHASCRSILGYSLGTTRKQRPEEIRKDAPVVMDLLAEGKLKIVIGKEFPLREASLAHEWIENRKSTGKVLLIP